MRFGARRTLLRSPPAAAAAGTAYVTGDRTGTITVTATTDLISGGAGPVTNLVDGAMGDDNNDSTFFSSGADASIHSIKFDFGTGKIVDEAKWYQSGAQSHGTWQWQGSNDDSGYSAIGSSFTLGGATTQTQTELNGNSTSYRYYRLTGISGNVSGSPFLREVEFKQN